MPFFVYLLGNSEGRLYVGQTSDLELRIRRHNEGKVRWTKSRGPWELLFSTPSPRRSAAMTEERRLKAMKSKQALLNYVAQPVESRRRRINR